MEKKKLTLIKSELMSLNKPNKTFRFYTIDRDLSQRTSTIVSTHKIISRKIKDSRINKLKNKTNLYSFSRAITSSNSFNKNYIKEKINKNNIRKNILPKIKLLNIKRENNIFIKIKNPYNSKTMSKKQSYKKNRISINNTNIYSNNTIYRNIEKINPYSVKNKEYSFNLFYNEKKKEEKKTINKNSSSLNFLYRRYKNKCNLAMNKSKNVNINPMIPLKGLNNLNALSSTIDFNYTNPNHLNINKMFININDFKKFSCELLKRKLKTCNNKLNMRIFHNNPNIGDNGIQTSLRMNKKESFISSNSTLTGLEQNSNIYKKVNVTSSLRTNKTNNSKKNKQYIIGNDKKILNIIKNSKIKTNRNNYKINISNNISHSSSINKLLNNYITYQSNKYNLLSNINNKKIKIHFNKKRNMNNINYNLTSINNLNNSTKNKANKLLKNHHNDIINITIDNTFNNIVNINGSLNNINNTATTISNSREKSNTYNKVNKILRNKKDIKKRENVSENKKEIKKDIKKKKSNNIIKGNVEDSKNTIKNKSQSYKNKKKKYSNFKSNKDLLYKKLIKKNNIKNLIKENKKNHSKNKINKTKKKYENNVLIENMKKIREERKKKSSIFSINGMKLNPNVKLHGLKTIFSNFYNIDKKQFISYRTPKIKSPSSFNSLNYLNISSRFNKTEEKVDLFKNDKTNDSVNKKYYIKIKNNPQYSYEYLDEIFQNLLIEENEYFEEINFGSFDKENYKYCINPESWKFFINSLINIQELLYFGERTLFLTVQIFDKYISNVLYKETNKNINEENLDIVIVTSLIIASKREEIKLYLMKDYLNLLPDKYSIKDLIKQENDILYKFKFNLLVPNILDFYEIFSIICKLDKIQRCKGQYLLNIILLDCNMLRIPPSLLAFSVIKIITKRDMKNYIFNRINRIYKILGKEKEIKALKILEDDNMINSICGYIQYIEEYIKLTNYDSVTNKFNNENYYYVPSYPNI